MTALSEVWSECDWSIPRSGCGTGPAEAKHAGAGLQERLEGRRHDERGDLHQYDPVGLWFTPSNIVA